MNGHGRATWIPSNFQNKRSIVKANRAIDKGASTYCGYTITTTANCLGGGGENQKLKSGEWVNDKTRKLALKYEQRRQEVQKSTTEEATFVNDSNSVPINDNDIYLKVVGGKNEKGNVYGLGKLTNKFMRSTRILTNLIDMSMVQQMEEMRETIDKLNNELVEKKKLRRSHLRRKCNCCIIIKSKMSIFNNKMKKMGQQHQQMDNKCN
ncbi:hypothetical protein CR513_02271, partial [Mucuna pruriens]